MTRGMRSALIGISNTNVTDVAPPYGTSTFTARNSLHTEDCTGGYQKFVTQGLNDDYLPLWLQEGGVNTYYVGKFTNGHTIHNYQDPAARGWTGTK